VVAGCSGSGRQGAEYWQRLEEEVLHCPETL
jgi:hypothetical protein